jgi:ATP-dependent DNA helicase RecQ
LAHYVQNGLIKIDDLVSKEKILLIEPEAKTFSGGSITSIKEKLGNQISFGEIRFVLGWIDYQNHLPI